MEHSREQLHPQQLTLPHQTSSRLQQNVDRKQ
jgi:hypothetical protein